MGSHKKGPIFVRSHLSRAFSVYEPNPVAQPLQQLGLTPEREYGLAQSAALSPTRSLSLTHSHSLTRTLTGPPRTYGAVVISPLELQTAGKLR